MARQHDYMNGMTPAEYAEVQVIAEKYDKEAPLRKDATLNMRISSQTLERVKQVAQKQGYSKYQAWVSRIIEQALNEA
jgi:predicted DNA binding CopG/RHH family protein